VPIYANFGNPHLEQCAAGFHTRAGELLRSLLPSSRINTAFAVILSKSMNQRFMRIFPSFQDCLPTHQRLHWPMIVCARAERP
jgi:hypothetical protein